MRKASDRVFYFCLFLGLACVGAFAQANSNLTGIVTDKTGAAVAGASMSLTDTATGSIRSTVSNEAGLYNFAGLNAGTYTLTARERGFETYVKSGIAIDISRTLRVDVPFAVGVETQTVSVSANALTVQTDSNVISTLISGQQITDLATDGRNIVGLATLGLGVSSNLPDANSPTSIGSSFAISFNGLSQSHNIWIIDGGEDYDRGTGSNLSVMPSQDALSEFQVLSSNYPPDYGISSGGTVTMSIKRGTERFHGELWEFVRNNAIQAYNYFATNPQTGVVSPKPVLRYNVFGANLGGPVIIPHIYNDSKKKTFFFYNEEWRREIQGLTPTAINTVPPGDNPTTAATFTYVLPAFSPSSQLAAGVGNQIFVPVVSDPAFNAKLAADGLTPGTPFPGNVIPGNLLDPNALLFNATKLVTPATNTINDTLTPQNVNLPTNVREDLFRIDHNINDKWSLFGHYIHDATNQSFGLNTWGIDSYPSVNSSFSNPSYSAVIKLTGELKPNVLLEAAFNYDGNKIDLQPVAENGASFTKPAGWSTQSYFPSNDPANRLPVVSFSTYGTSCCVAWIPWTNAAEDYNEIFGLSVTKGTHQMKFGGGYNRYTKNQIIGDVTQGTYTFGDGWAGTAPSGPLTGDSYLDFELGLSTNFTQSGTNPINHYVNNTVSAYAQDNWHVTSRLSIQYGLRYDSIPHVWERNNQISSFAPAQYQRGLTPVFTSSGAFAPNSPGLQTINGAQFYMNGVVVAGQMGTPRGLVKNDYDTYMPRFGFSYDLTGSGKTVLRAGFGTFFERIQGNDVYNIAGLAPFVNTPSANNVEFTNPNYNWQAGTSASSPLFPASPTSIDPYYPQPGVAQYSMGIQHEILPSLILVTQYVGNIGWHQSIDLPINNFPLSAPLATRQAFANGTLSTIDTLNARTYPGFGGITQETNASTSSYNGFQTGLRQQSRFGLSFDVNYTWSHEIDTEPGSADLTTASNPWNLKYDKGSGALDRRQILSIDYIYNLPLFAHGSGLSHKVLGGWELSGTVISESGLPWAGNTAPASGYADTIGLGGSYTNRASIIPGQKVRYPKRKDANGVYQWVSNSAFEAPVAPWDGGSGLGFGDAGRDCVVGPGRTNFSTSLYKSFAIGEQTHFEFRAESFNTFNHTQFASGSAAGAFNTSVASSTFGEATGAADPRTFEFGAKFVF